MRPIVQIFNPKDARRFGRAVACDPPAAAAGVEVEINTLAKTPNNGQRPHRRVPAHEVRFAPNPSLPNAKREGRISVLANPIDCSLSK